MSGLRAREMNCQGFLDGWSALRGNPFAQEYFRMIELHPCRYPAREPVVYALRAAFLVVAEQLRNFRRAAQGFDKLFVWS